MKRPKIHLHTTSREEDAATGARLTIRAGICEGPFGECLIAESSVGICHLSLFDTGCSEMPVSELQAEWSGATFIWDHTHAAGIGGRIFSRDPGESWDVHVRGTPFQIQVWRALLAIPPGKVMGYGALAEVIGHPKASRATGSAVGKNEVSLLIPCHRVIRADGSCGHYRWGAGRKASILRWEGVSLD